MKIAVCLSGIMEHSDKSLKSIKNIVPNTDIKIFIHTWQMDESEVLNKDEIDNQLKQNLQHYNAEEILIEKFSKKKKLFEKIYKNMKMDPNPPNYVGFLRSDLGIISMWYSIFKSNQLKRNYEKKNNIIFDKVVRMRFDSDFFDEKYIMNENENGIEIPWKDDWGGICDRFAVGPSKEIDHYSNLYNCLLKMNDIYYHPETILRKYIETYPLKYNISRIPFLVGINGITKDEAIRIRV
ncbi:MAG: hypothetical protein ACO25K_06495 [Candidatus Fonsibacter ubiquis]